VKHFCLHYAFFLLILGHNKISIHLRGRVQFPTGGNWTAVLKPASRKTQDLVRFQSRQYSLDGRRWRCGRVSFTYKRNAIL